MIRQDVALVVNGEVIEALCTDVGVGGAFVEMIEPLSVGSRATLLIELPGSERRTAIESIVRWTTESGVGLQFGVMGARETHALVTLLGRLSAA